MNMNIYVPEPVSGKSLQNYFLEHAVPTGLEPKNVGQGEFVGEGQFYQVVNELKVFKKARYKKDKTSVGCSGQELIIINLIIPEGAIIYASSIAWWRWSFAPHDRKMRASSAKVHSMYNLRGDEVKLGYSLNGYMPHGNTFHYTKGKVVKPTSMTRFFENTPCAHGIHFFLNLYDAVYYS